MEVPCGKCVGCYMDNAMMWKARIVHEASLYSSNVFITLTYADDRLPPSLSLEHRDFQLFMKRFRVARARENPALGPVRFFMCGEYGSQTGRPHFHAVLFNTAFGDLRPWRKDSFRSGELEGAWSDDRGPLGHCEVGLFTPGRAAYVAGYVMKKAQRRTADAVNRATGEVVERRPEYRKMSQGIGREWYNRFWRDLFPSDQAVVEGKVYKVPRYYLQRLKAAQPDMEREVRERRCRRAMELPEEESSLERRAVREELALRNLTMERGL